MYFLDRGQKVEVLRQRRKITGETVKAHHGQMSLGQRGKTSSAASSGREVGRARLGLLVDGVDGRG